MALDKSRSCWQFVLTPYFWTPGLDGGVGVRGRTAPVDVGFSDVADALDMGSLLAFEARKQRWSVLFDAIYLKLSTDQATPGPLFSCVDLGMKQTVLEGDIASRWTSRTTALLTTSRPAGWRSD